MDFGLTNKRAFVGGGSRGIGKAIAIELAKEGCDVVIASRTQSSLEETSKEIEDLTGRRIIPLALDVTSREQVDSTMAEGVQQLGGLDILVNSASLPGGSRSAVGPIDGLDEDALLSDFDTKYVGALRCARAANDTVLTRKVWPVRIRPNIDFFSGQVASFLGLNKQLALLLNCPVSVDRNLFTSFPLAS